MATFTNQARLTYTGGSAASNITVGELVEVLTATKTAVVPNYERGGTVTYLITLTNTGTTALTNLTVTDEEMDAAIQRICADNHMSAEDLKPYFDNGFLTVVRQQMLRDKATEVVRRSAQITQ